MKHSMQTSEQGQPWITYTYGLTHDSWWPAWNSTRVLGYARIQMECLVCGVTKIAKIKMPRFRDVPAGQPHHPKRLAFMAEHAHPDRGHPISWAKPLANLAVFGDEGLRLDLLAMRIKADLEDGAK